MKRTMVFLLISLMVLLVSSASSIYSITPSPTPSPTASPDCPHKIVFTSTGTADIFEIMVMDSDGKNIVNVTNNMADDMDPTWSPDGKKIAFASDLGNPSSLKTQIHTMNSDGTGVFRLTNILINSRYPAWSPDGKKIAFAYELSDTQSEIYLINADGIGSKRLTFGSRFNISPAWSPDGKKIAYASAIWDGKKIEFVNFDIYEMNSDGTHNHKLTTSIDNDESPSWSPDGKSIAFASNRRGNYEIFIMDFKTTLVRQLTFSPGSEQSHPNWSPDGKHILFDSDRDHQGGEIYHVDLSGKDWVQLTNTTQHHMTWQPVWSPVCNISTP